MPTSPLAFTWQTLQDQSAPPLAAIHIRDIIELRVAKNYCTATIQHAGIPDHLHARWPLSHARLLLVHRISILAFLAFLQALPAQPNQPIHQPEDILWTVQALRRHGIQHPGQWIEVNPRVHLRTTLNPSEQVRLAKGTKDTRWKLHLLSTGQGQAATLSLPPWLRQVLHQVPRQTNSTPDALKDGVEQALLLRDIRPPWPLDHGDYQVLITDPVLGP